jgi:hypothetical protein
MQQKTYVMLNKIQVSYGYKTVQIATLTLHTGKIRVKTDLETVNDFFSMEERRQGVDIYCGKNNTVIVTWAVTDITVHHAIISKMNRLLAYVMHKRIAYKYGELVEQVPDLAW